MKTFCSFLLIIALLACNENLVDKPDNLIPEDKMVAVLTDLAIVNAAKSTNIAVLHDNDIEPMQYVYEKHDIDSLQFVESDFYYASLPKGAYERIYKKVEARLEKKAKAVEEAKVLRDSLGKVERENLSNAADAEKADKEGAVTDSLP